MKQIITLEQALHIDLRTQQLDRIAAESLMERAGQMAARRLKRDFTKPSKIVFLIGPGNNGGDGLVMARLLLAEVSSIVIVCPTEGTSELWIQKKSDLFQQLQRVLAKNSDSPKTPLRPTLVWLTGKKALNRFMTRAEGSSWTLFIDTGFGVGLSRPLSFQWQQVIRFLQKRSRRCVAIDIPSGLNATTGIATVGAVKADYTYTMGYAKVGLLTGDGVEHAGKIKILDIGFSPKVAAELSPRIFYYGKPQAHKALPGASHWSSHKSKRGHLLVLAGSSGMEGAGALTSLAGARAGAGYVTWARWSQDRYDVCVPPSILTATIDEEFQFLEKLKKPTAVVIGPGLGLTAEAGLLLKKVYRQFSNAAVVVDADALHLLKREGLFPVPPQWILTPHSGELGRLLDVETSDINNNRLEFLMAACRGFGGCVLLKGFRSLVAETESHIRLIGAGGPILGKAGTGDVLAGFIGGFLAGGMAPFEALSLATYLHGKIGDIYAKMWKNDFTLVATDLIDAFPVVVRGLNVNSNAKAP